MTAFTGTVDVKGVGGEVGKQMVATGYFALTGAIAAADTITFTDILPERGAKVVRFEVVTPELDTDASPTGTWKIGDGTDDDGYVLATNIGLPAQAPANGQQIQHVGTGALIGTVVTGRSVVITIVGVMATSATTGTIRIFVTLEGVAA